ncbi:hypothetical protein Tco_0709894, partial [Tanacetum coccineum]
SEAKENIAKVQEKLEDEEIEKMVEGEDDEESYAKPESHQEHPENVDDDDYETNKEKKDDKKDDEKRIMMRRRMRRVELTKTVSPSNATTSKAQHKTKHISSKYSHILRVIHRMCRHQGYMIQRMEKKYVTDNEFWKVQGKVDNVYHEIIPHITEKATNDAPQIIEELFKSYVSNNVIQVHPTISTTTSTTSSTDLQQQLYLKLKSNIQDQAADLELWDVLKRKFEKYYTLTTSCRDDAFRLKHHDDHQEDEAPPEKGGIYLV